jgi:hypothetical protein
MSEWQVLPLEGKHYGTLIEIGGVGHIKVWVHESRVPSARQLEDWGMTLEEARAEGMMCDDHFESQSDYDLSCRIAALPQLERERDDLSAEVERLRDVQGAFVRDNNDKTNTVRDLLAEVERLRKLWADPRLALTYDDLTMAEWIMDRLGPDTQGGPWSESRVLAATDRIRAAIDHLFDEDEKKVRDA